MTRLVSWEYVYLPRSCANTYVGRFADPGRKLHVEVHNKTEAQKFSSASQAAIGSYKRAHAEMCEKQLANYAGFQTSIDGVIASQCEVFDGMKESLATMCESMKSQERALLEKAKDYVTQTKTERKEVTLPKLATPLYCSCAVAEASFVCNFDLV